MPLEKFINPYYGNPAVERLNIDVAINDKRIINSIHPTRGFITTAISIFIKRLADECREKKYTYDDEHKLEQFCLDRLGPGPYQPGGAVVDSPGLPPTDFTVRRTVADPSAGIPCTANKQPSSSNAKTSKKGTIRA